MSNGEWCLECGLERAITSAGRCGKCAIVSQSSDIAYELATLRARVEELEKERARECAWTLDGEPTQAIEWYDTGCGRQASVGAALMADRPCYCGGKVRVEKGDE